jgi:queuine tRNA-ribosyltransferase
VPKKQADDAKNRDEFEQKDTKDRKSKERAFPGGLRAPLFKFPFPQMTASRLDFRIEAAAEGSRARAGRFRTLHNEVLTPLFMPVGTQATVKAQLPEALEESGSQILLANTYHLLLRPGPEVFERLGGIHGFMKWDRSVLTDSGGFQIFSLPHSRSMSEEGAVFASYVDGKTILLSPERSILTQRSIGSDIMMVLDQCIPSTADRRSARAALGITQRWAERSLAARGDSPQSLFAIVQGALYQDLREESAAGLTPLPFDGFAIGGLAVGEDKTQREDTCEFTAALLPPDKPRYLMGVGTPLDILEAVHRGVDMFDCIIPTQVAKRGTLFTSRGIVQLRRSVYKFQDTPADPVCACPVCAKYSRAYLHHLTKTQEALGWQLMGQHNIWFYHQMMREIRAAILSGNFPAYYQAQRQILDVEDMDFPTPAAAQPAPPRPLTLGAYEVHTAMEGFSSIRHLTSGEIMHSRTPPMVEAQALYVDQSRLAERAHLLPGESPETAAPLVIWDVGLGAAANAMAALLTYEAQAAIGPVRGLQIISFENDLDPLRLALRHKKRFPYLDHGAADALAIRGAWHSRRFPRLTWKLIRGDFRETLTQAAALPDFIYYDLWSGRTQSEAWSITAFQQLFQACQSKPCSLFTYTTSTAARVALLASGWHVARGVAAGVKAETTIALTSPGDYGPWHLLGSAWLGKWSRSHAQFPDDLPPSSREAFAARLREHPQFRTPLPQPVS